MLFENINKTLQALKKIKHEFNLYFGLNVFIFAIRLCGVLASNTYRRVYYLHRYHRGCCSGQVEDGAW